MPGKLCRSDLPRAVRLYPPKLSYMTGRRWFPGIPCVGKEFASARTSNLIMTGGDPTMHTAHLFTNGGACCGAVSAPVYGFFSPLKKLVLGTMLRTRVSQLGPNFTDLRRRFLYKNQYIAARLGARSWRTRWVKRNGRRMTLCRENGRRWPFGGRRPSFAAQIVGDWPVPCGPFVKFVGSAFERASNGKSRLS